MAGECVFLRIGKGELRFIDRHAITVVSDGLVSVGLSCDKGVINADEYDLCGF